MKFNKTKAIEEFEKQAEYKFERQDKEYNGTGHFTYRQFAKWLVEDIECPRCKGNPLYREYNNKTCLKCTDKNGVIQCTIHRVMRFIK